MTVAPPPPPPARDSLDLIRSFAGTLNSGPDHDQLRAREDAASWLHAAGLLPAEAGLSNSEHAALIRLRDALRDMLAALAGGQEGADAQDAAARLTRALAEGRLIVLVSPAGQVRLASAARSSYPSVVAGMAVAIAEAAATGHWPRLRP